MNSFDYLDELWNLFSNDPALAELLGLSEEADNYSSKIYLQEMPVEEYDTDNLPMIEVYFADAESTFNDFAKKGILHIDIMVNKAEMFAAGGEGQFESGIRDIYKYRVVYTPLINTKG